MTVEVLEEVGTVDDSCIDNVVLSIDTEPPDFLNADTHKDNRFLLTFLGNRPSVKKTKNPTLHFLLEDTTSPVNVSGQRYQAIYFSISPTSIAGRYWSDALITKEDAVISIHGESKRTVPFKVEKSHWKLYHKNLFLKIYDLTEPQIPIGYNPQEYVPELYTRLRDDFNDAMDSTRRVWGLRGLPLRMFSGKTKGYRLFAAAESVVFSTVAGLSSFVYLCASGHLSNPLETGPGIYFPVTGCLLSLAALNTALYIKIQRDLKNDRLMPSLANIQY